LALFTKDTIDRVREAVDMVQLVGAKTDLRRVGSRWTGLCPFHEERTPSFSVNAEEKLYHCFGCGEGGDAIRFVMETEALEFPEAVEVLADRYGVRVEREQDDPQAEGARRRRERLLALLERAARYYANYLWESKEAAGGRDYLAGRGLSEAVLRDFSVGYSPSAWDRMLLASRSAGFSEEELYASGLAQRGRGGALYDRFRGRIMFPLADARGRVLGFGARRMREDGPGPKYLNTSENELYRKGRQLFGLDRARASANKTGRIVVVEGYTDVLALHQAGITEAVAIMGTALTPEQLQQIEKALPSGRVLLALDADRSGQEAMLRAARIAEDRGLDLQVIEMPVGTDPADFVTSEGVGAFQLRMGRSVPMIQFQIRRVLADADLDTPTGRDKALEEARRLIAAVPDRTATRDELVREVADRLDVPAEWVTDTTRRVAPATPAGSAGDVIFKPDHEFLIMCLASDELGREYLSRPGDELFIATSVRRARAHLAEHFDDPLISLAEEDPATAVVIHNVSAEAQERRSYEEHELRSQVLQLEQRRLDHEIKIASRDGDHARQSELTAARQRVREELGGVMR